MNSMTGYGSGQAEARDLGFLSIEMRSVNNRFLDLTIRLPQELTWLEPFARAEIQKRFSRGKIYVNTRFDPIPGATERYQLNKPFLDMLESCCKERGVENPDLEQLLGIEGVVVVQTDESRQGELEKLFRSALSDAMTSLEAERRREGEVLRKALLALHGEMRGRLDVIETARSQVVEKYRQRLHERIDDLLGPQSAAVDPGRLEQEVALFADKADISEEVTRLSAHLEHFHSLMAKENADVQGRALDFLAQEVLRETNTIGSKARDLEITRQVLDLKGQIESLKEQIANVE